MSAMVVRRSLRLRVALSFEEGEGGSSHISVSREPSVEVNDKFFRSCSFQPSFGNKEDGMRMDGSMTNSPRMGVHSVESEKKLVGFVLKAGGGPGGKGLLELPDSA